MYLKQIVFESLNGELEQSGFKHCTGPWISFVREIGDEIQRIDVINQVSTHTLTVDLGRSTLSQASQLVGLDDFENRDGYSYGQDFGGLERALATVICDLREFGYNWFLGQTVINKKRQRNLALAGTAKFEKLVRDARTSFRCRDYKKAVDLYLEAKSLGELSSTDKKFLASAQKR